MTTQQILFIAVFLFNGVFSEDTGSPEVDLLLYEVPTTVLPGCYGGELSSLHEIGWRMGHTAVDTLGRRCYKAISENELLSFTKDNLVEAFANVSGEVCPSWTQSKECLRRHLSKACNSVETQNVQASNSFNEGLVFSELICEPLEGYNILQMFKDAAVDGGLGDCLSEPKSLDDLFACIGTGMHVKKEENTIPPFKEVIPLIFECGDRTLKVCANGNMEQEMALVSLWNKFQKAVQEAHGSLWNHLITPVSILDLLK